MLQMRLETARHPSQKWSGTEVKETENGLGPKKKKPKMVWDVNDVLNKHKDRSRLATSRPHEFQIRIY